MNKILIASVMSGRGLGPELVSNGNMEAGSPPTGWLQGAPGAVLTRAADQCTGGVGSYSLDAAVDTGQVSGSVLATITLAAGKRYRLRVGYKNINTSQIAFTVYDSSWGVLYTSAALYDTAWAFLTTDFTAPTAGGYLSFVVVGSPGQHARVDDFSVKSL